MILCLCKRITNDFILRSIQLKIRLLLTLGEHMMVFERILIYECKVYFVHSFEYTQLTLKRMCWQYVAIIIIIISIRNNWSAENNSFVLWRRKDSYYYVLTLQSPFCISHISFECKTCVEYFNVSPASPSVVRNRFVSREWRAPDVKINETKRCFQTTRFSARHVLYASKTSLSCCYVEFQLSCRTRHVPE